MALIGISGKINSGKDLTGTIIQYLFDYHKAGYTHPISDKDFNDFIRNGHQKGSSFKIKKFAGKLKDMVCLLTGCTREQLEDNEFKKQLLPAEWSYLWGYDNTRQVKTKISATEEMQSRAKQYTYWELLQYIGTELMRDQLHYNVWVNALFADYKIIYTYIWNEGFYENRCIACKNSFMGVKLQRVCKECCISIKEKEPNWIVTDVIFPNEAEAIESRNGILIRINRGWIDAKEANEMAKGSALYNPNFKEAHTSETALDDYKFKYTIDNNGTIEELIEKVKSILQAENII